MTVNELIDLKKFWIAAEQNGVHMFSDDYLAQILAVMSVIGGGEEAFVLNVALNTIVEIAQIRFNIFGGEIPKAEGVLLIQKYVKELEAYIISPAATPAPACGNELPMATPAPAWAVEICDRYKLHGLAKK